MSLSIQVLCIICSFCVCSPTVATNNESLIVSGGLISTSGLVYDPSNGCTLENNNFGYDGSDFLATSSCNGKLYASYDHSITIWDAATNNGQTLDNLTNSIRLYHSMDCVNKGTDLLLCGGDGGLTSCELCHVSRPNPLCVPTTDMPAHRWKHASVTVDDTKLLIIGGNDNEGFAVNTVYIYYGAPNGTHWEWYPLMHEQRGTWPGAVMLDPHRVLVCGGHGNSRHQYLASCEMLNTSQYWLGWTIVEPMQQPRAYFGMVYMGDGLIHAFGGQNEEPEILKSVEFLDPADMKWQYARFNLTQPMRTFTAVGLK